MKVIIDGKEYEGKEVELDNFSEIMWSDSGNKFRVRDRRFIKKEFYPIVPENIKIVKHEYIDRTGILFGNKQLLWVYDGTYIVDYYDKPNWDEIDCELVPCERKDLVAGDIAYCKQFYTVEFDFSELKGYCVILDKKNQVNIEGNTDCFVEAWDSRCKWWRVRPISKGSEK